MSAADCPTQPPPADLVAHDCGCPDWPACNHEIRWEPAAPTRPAPPVDPVPGVLALALEIRALRRRYARAEAALSATDAARLRRGLIVALAAADRPG